MEEAPAPPPTTTAQQREALLARLASLDEAVEDERAEQRRTGRYPNDAAPVEMQVSLRAAWGGRVPDQPVDVSAKLAGISRPSGRAVPRRLRIKETIATAKRDRVQRAHNAWALDREARLTQIAAKRLELAEADVFAPGRVSSSSSSRCFVAPSSRLREMMLSARRVEQGAVLCERRHNSAATFERLPARRAGAPRGSAQRSRQGAPRAGTGHGAGRGPGPASREAARVPEEGRGRPPDAKRRARGVGGGATRVVRSPAAGPRRGPRRGGGETAAGGENFHAVDLEASTWPSGDLIRA